MKLSIEIHSISGKMINKDGAVGEMTVGRGKSRCSEKTYPYAILSTKNSI
jgi:hypothetical protein